MKRYALIIFIMLFMGMGCSHSLFRIQSQSPVPLESLEETIQWARENVEVLQRLPLEQEDMEEFQQAKSTLDAAARAFESAFYDQAYISALDSISISQGLLRRFYNEKIVSQARETKERIETIAAEDPDSPLQEFLPMLTEILDYSEEIGASQQDIDVARVLADFGNISEIEQNTQKAVKYTVESDISFESGQYRLSERGKQAITTYCQEILMATQGLTELYPERDIVVRINIAGYSDPVDFRERTNLLEVLTDGIDPQTIPQQEVELRKFLNRRLSEFRVVTIGEYLHECLQQGEPGIMIEQHGVGFGEELPPGVPPSELSFDPKRRICKIYTYILLR